MSGTGLRDNQTTHRTVEVGALALPVQAQQTSPNEDLDLMLAKNRVSLNSILESTPWNAKSLH